MPASGSVYYLNGGFDLRLARDVPDRLARLVPEMTLWYLPAAAEHDAVITDERVPPAYMEYLAKSGLGQAQILSCTGEAKGSMGHPWGWDNHAAAVLRRVRAVLDHPDLETVRRVNGRSFSYELAERLGCAVPGATKCCTATQAAHALEAAGTWPRVVKPEHGNAGISFRIVNGPEHRAAALKAAARVLESGHGPVFVEPWLERRGDISVRFDLGPDGALSGMRRARARVSPIGVSYAIVENDGDPLLDVHEKTLSGIAVEAGASLHAAGYWGPVNIDAMLARRGGAEQLFPLLEINARDSMSRIAHALALRLGCTGWRQLRTVGGARPGLPADYRELDTRLGPAAFDPRTRTGILTITPLRIGSPPRVPHRSIFFAAAGTEAELSALDCALTALLRPPAR